MHIFIIGLPMMKRTVKEVEVVWACDQKRGTLRRKEGDVMKVHGRRKRGRPKRR